MKPKILLLTGDTNKYTQYLLSQILNSTMIPLSEVVISSLIPQEANVTVTFGQDVLSLLSNEKLTNVRGTVLKGTDGRKIIPSLDLSDLVKDLSLDIILRGDLIKARKEKETSFYEEPKWNFIINPFFIDCIQYLDLLISLNSPEGYIAFDLETDLKNQQILCLGLAHSETEGISIPFFDSSTGKSHWTLEEEKALWQKIGEFFMSPVRKVAHNACFDVSSLWRSEERRVGKES